MHCGYDKWYRQVSARMEVSVSAWGRDVSLHPDSGSPWTSRKCNRSCKKVIARDDPYSWFFPHFCLSTCKKMSSAVVLNPQLQAHKVWTIHWKMEVPILCWIQQIVMACRWGPPLWFFQGPYVHYKLTLEQLGPISRLVCSEHVSRSKNYFYQVRTEGWTSFFLADLPFFLW